jgi:hypothetical protein
MIERDDVDLDLVSARLADRVRRARHLDRLRGWPPGS